MAYNETFPSRIYDVNTGKYAKVSSFGSLVAAGMHGLVNTTFFLATSVTDAYTVTSTGTGTATSNTTDGFFTMASGTTNPSSIRIISLDFATYDGISPLLFLNGLRAPQAGQAACIRRWGVSDAGATNGFFFEDNAGTFRVVTRKNSVDTVVASGSFNGLMGATYVLDQNSHFFEIEITGGRSVFMIDQTVLHTMAMPAGTTTQSATLNLRVFVEIVSTGTTNMTLEGRGHNIARLGDIDSKRLLEGLKDTDDATLTKAVITGRTAADTYVPIYTDASGNLRILLPTGAAQDGTDITTPTAMPAGGVGVRGWLSAIWTKLNGTLGVTGTFWQATQPVSLAATVITDPSDRVARAIGTVTQQAITKGTQGVTGVTTQDLKDAGRSQILLAWEEMAGTAAVESVLTNFTLGSKAAAALTAATSYTVTAGKTLRIQSVNIYVKETSTVLNLGRFRIRQAATVANTSPVIWDSLLIGTMGSGSSVAGNGSHLSIPIPDGLEVAGGQQITFTWFTPANTCTVGLTMIGYEY